MAATWKGFLSFGLLSIPISLSPAARTERISFNQLHSVCHSRIKMPSYCPTCEKFVERSEIEKGYEYEEGQYLLFTKQELEEVEPDSAKTMEIIQFVKAEEIDPVYFDASYYATPKEEGQLAYNLLLHAMRKTGYAGIAKVTMFGRENIVVIRGRDNGMTIHTMFYSHEVRASDMHLPKDLKVKDAESKLATQLIESLAAPFKPEEFTDTYHEGLQQLIEAKAKGKKLTVVHRGKAAPVVDMMTALKQSLSKTAERGKEPKKTLLRVVPNARKERRAG
jgi:DNA end-binding protein Ku